MRVNNSVMSKSLTYRNKRITEVLLYFFCVEEFKGCLINRCSSILIWMVHHVKKATITAKCIWSDYGSMILAL